MQEYKSNPPKLNPRCWNCHKPMSKTLRAMTVFCTPKCEREYHSTEQGYALTPVIAIFAAFTTALVLLAQSGLLHSVVAEFAQLGVR